MRSKFPASIWGAYDHSKGRPYLKLYSRILFLEKKRDSC
jgi:hypothetical protein